MALIGGNLEKKEIGLPIGVSGTHDNTEINKTTGFLQLVEVDVDGQGNPIYTEEGSWTSDVIDLGDVFQDFEKIFTTNTNNGASSFAVLTRVSDNGRDWSDWVAIAEDGAIQSDTKQYIQVKIDLFAGFVTDVFFISNSDFEENEFVTQKKLTDGGYKTPTLTSNTSSPLGFSFASSEYSTSYQAWKSFDKSDSGHFTTANNVSLGFLGFRFNEAKRFMKYKIRSTDLATLTPMPKNWILQGSDNTTNGTDGTWKNLDFQTNQSWTSPSTNKEYSFVNNTKYYAYRIKWSENNGSSMTSVGELDFYEEGTTSLQLKREYQHDMTLDSTWSNTGSLHRKKITRVDWVRIDKLNPVFKN
ncbi:hypothetical protein ACMGD3_12620 [Lysinibacillus sphaericus]|uniref:hypothetical protein n=1 Tax=Lysinibacillus sphaericus TaxID=1421 RepID=UPI003F78C02F